MNTPTLTRTTTRQTLDEVAPQLRRQDDDAIRDHVLAELRRLDLDGVLIADERHRVVRRDSYGGTLELDLEEFSELAATVADGSGLRGFYVARDGYRDDGAVRAIDAELARCRITGYAAGHRTKGGENGIAVKDVGGRELRGPPGDPHARELLRLLRTLPDDCGVAVYLVALAALTHSDVVSV
jgi:hypothetical protein